MDIDLELVFDVEIHCTLFINPATTRNPYNGLLGFVSVAGLMGFNSSFLGYVGAIGDYGTYKDVDNLPKNGYYDVKGTSNITGTVPFQSYGLLMNISGIGTSGYGFQLLLANNSTSTGTRIAMRVRINNTWIGWTTLS